jgi:hypothetical protein
VRCERELLASSPTAVPGQAQDRALESLSESADQPIEAEEHSSGEGPTADRFLAMRGAPVAGSRECGYV